MDKTLDKTVLLLVSIAPLLIPFGLVRNIGLQAILVTLTGILAWSSLYLKYRSKRIWWSNPLVILLAIYVLSCLASIAFNPGILSAFGTPLTRLGAVQLLACAGIGLTLRRIPHATLATYLYVPLAVLAVISLPYSFYHPLGTLRIGGPLYQPDFLAVIVAITFLLGLLVWKYRAEYRTVVAVLQSYLIIVLFLTQTRAVIAILLLIVLLLIWLQPAEWRKKLLMSVVPIAVISFGMVLVTPLGNRLSDTAYAANSATYRIELQATGARHLTDRPITGYGTGNLSKPLACKNLTAPNLIKTCKDGYYFNSSHNIFLDRLLALGWLGGVSFLGLCVLLLWRCLRQPQTRIFGAIALLIMLYYLTNISSITIELLLWVSLLRACDKNHIIIDNSKHKRI